MRICKVGGCSNKHLAKGLCNAHYRRMKRHGIYDYTPKHSRYTHGMSKLGEYRVWLGMKNRCYTPTDTNYKRYGARGIEVSISWLNSFENFHKDMGRRPDGYQIDRIDNNGNYCKDNCRWISRKDNNRNRRDNHYIEYNGETKSLVEWAEVLDIKQKTLSHRINGLKWSIDKAFNTPVRHITKSNL